MYISLKENTFYSILFYSILFYSILGCGGGGECAGSPALPLLPPPPARPLPPAGPRRLALPHKQHTRQVHIIPFKGTVA
jgi:hypothetical protein